MNGLPQLFPPFGGLGFQIVVLPRHVRPYPKLERERSRDGCSVNISAKARNAKKIEDASVCLVDQVSRTIFAPSWMVPKLQEAVAKAGLLP